MSNNSNKNLKANADDIVFQVTDWNTSHEDIEYGDETLKKYIISMYGTTQDNKKIYVKVKDYTPYFYVGIPLNWGSAQSKKAQLLINTVKSDPIRKTALNNTENSLTT